LHHKQDKDLVCNGGCAVLQVPPTIMEDQAVAAVPELEIRRSLSEPMVISRRGALELRRKMEAAPFVRRGFAMAGAPPSGQLLHVARERFISMQQVGQRHQQRSNVLSRQTRSMWKLSTLARSC